MVASFPTDMHHSADQLVALILLPNLPATTASVQTASTQAFNTHKPASHIHTSQSLAKLSLKNLLPTTLTKTSV